MLQFMYLQQTGVGDSMRQLSQDSDSDDDIPDELKQDFIDEQTGESPQINRYQRD